MMDPRLASTAGAVVLVAGFAVLAKLLHLTAAGSRAIAVARAASADVQNEALSDDEKEAAMRRHSGALFGLFFRLSLIGAICLLVPTGALWLLERAGLLPLRASMDRALSWPFLLGTTGVMGLWLVAARRGQGAPARGFQNTYSTLDRMLHRIAFSSPTAQLGLADMEAERFRAQLDATPSGAPVFVTALPRAGTTLLLELCVGTHEFASHTYADMPFLLAPLMWSGIAARLRKRSQESQERAHGDGMMVNVDSPEAFDEVVWRAFWRAHYQADRIRPWSDDEADPEFTEFLRRHARKIVALRRAPTAQPERYISKNNLNIARVGALLRVFPDAVIVLAFRDPRQHARSLLRQHLNFSEMHARDDFARRYMEDIGHYDFGANLRPVDFDGWLATARCRDPKTIGFWLEYWTAAYRHLLRTAAALPQVTILSYDRLCEDPERGLAALARVLRSKDPQRLVAQAGTLRVDEPREVDLSGVPDDVVRAVDECLAELKARALAW